MKIGIIATMEQELKLLVGHLGNKVEHQILGNIYHGDKLRNHDVVLVQSGVGEVMSAMSVAVLASHFGADAFINAGSAGAIATGSNIGDVVVADKLVYHNVNVVAFSHDHGQMAGQSLCFEPDKGLIDTSEQVLNKANVASKIGLIATGDSFIAGQDKTDAIKTASPEVQVIGMEGVAIVQAAHSLNKSFTIACAMSDTVTHDANITFNEFIIKAGK